MRRSKLFLAVLVALMLARFSFAADKLPDPEKPGPYPVGVMTMVFVDSSRTDATTKGPRTLKTEIWYPASDDLKGVEKNHLLDYYDGGKNPELMQVVNMAFKTDLVALDKTYPSVAYRDAKVRDGKYPLLLFSHGNGGIRSQSTFWCEHLASHGYIVVSPDHTGNSTVTTVDGKVVIYNNDRHQSAEDRPKDISFLIDTMDRLNKEADSKFKDKVDLDHIGVSGHSFGGYTSTWVADKDPRVKAIAPMAGVGETRTNNAIPVMFILATEDRTIKAPGNSRIRQFYNQATGPRYIVEFKNGGHYSFTGMFYFNPKHGDGVGEGKRLADDQPVTYTPMDTVYKFTNAYTTAFFGKFLKGLNGYDKYLNENHDSADLIVKWGEPLELPAAAPTVASAAPAAAQAQPAAPAPAK